MRHRTPRARGQPLRAVCPRNVVRLFRPLGRNWTTRINSGRPTVRLPQTEAWAERERVPSGHNCRRQLATGRPEQIQEPGTAVPGTPIFANNAQRGGPPLESPCRVLSLVLSFASKESTPPSGRQPHHSRRSRRVRPQSGQWVCACGRTKGLSARPLETFGHRRWRNPIGRQIPTRAVVGASIPTRGRGMRLQAHQRAFRSPFGNLRAPKVAEPHRTTNSNPRRSQRVQPRRYCLTRKLLFAAARNGLSVPLCPLGHFILFLLNPHPAAALSFPQR